MRLGRWAARESPIRGQAGTCATNFAGRCALRPGKVWRDRFLRPLQRCSNMAVAPIHIAVNSGHVMLEAWWRMKASRMQRRSAQTPSPRRITSAPKTGTQTDRNVTELTSQAYGAACSPIRNWVQGPTSMSRRTGDSQEYSLCSARNFAASKLTPHGCPMRAMNRIPPAMLLSIAFP
jgi:hypothetical protein